MLSSVVVPLKKPDALAQFQTLGQLVDAADGIPEGEILDAIIKHLREAERLRAAGDESALLRHLASAGTLCSRWVYEVWNLPKRHSCPLPKAGQSVAVIAASLYIGGGALAHSAIAAAGCLGCLATAVL